MNIKNRKKLEMIEQLLELAEKHNKDVNVEMGIYCNPSIDVIKEAKVLFKGRLRSGIQKSEGNRWIRFHNAPEGKDYLAGDLKISIFYPRN